MKNLLGISIVLFCISIQAQDSSYFFAGWGKPGTSRFVAFDSLRSTQYTQVKMSESKPLLIKHYSADHVIQNHIENEYDQYGNHKASRSYDGQGRLREETIFQNDPSEMSLFRTIFGETFIPANSNFMIRREYNDFERETGYYIIGVRGQTLCSRITLYREDRRKEREILKDDLEGKVLTERRYNYIDEENRTVLEEFNGAGKMVQRVVLFDHHDIIQE
ncbi:MAG: hypothetical protein HQ508_00580 [Candidatus Marinimicrobia bacterium]|nr:hypothetical protein [Candidatus Neomarinimicrobiota bacterium]